MCAIIWVTLHGVSSEGRDAVPERQRVVHLRTGSPEDASRIDAWLRDAGALADCFDDAYAACAELIVNHAVVPGVVLVGLDRLSPDDADILRHVADTWPAARVIAYGSVPPGASLCGATHCGSWTALERALVLQAVCDSGPGAAMTSVRSAPPASNPTAPATPIHSLLPNTPAELAEPLTTRSTSGVLVSAAERAALLGPSTR